MVGPHVGMAQHDRRWFRALARCRPEAGGQFSRWGPAVARHPAVEGYAPRKEPFHSWGLNRRGPTGRCADQRSAFQAVPALLLYRLLLGFAALWARCRRHPAVEGYAPRREPSHSWGLNRRGPAGRCAGLKTGVPSHSRSGKERRRKKTCQARLRNGGHRNMRHTASITAGLRIPASRRRIQRRERNRDRSLAPE